MAKKPQGRVSKAFERVALGGIMTVVAFVVERRLIKVIKKRGQQDEEASAPSADGGASGPELRASSP